MDQAVVPEGDHYIGGVYTAGDPRKIGKGWGIDQFLGSSLA